MVLEKNSELIINIYKVMIRSTDLAADLPSLQTIYHTPSKIGFTSRGENTRHGNLYTKTLRLSYPGLSTLDFENFNELLRGTYQVYLELEGGEIYEVATSQFPMECTTDFGMDSGHQVVFSSTSPYSFSYVTTVIPGQSPPLEEIFDFDFDFNLA
ncbi:hypothetical protein L0P88_04095 [Muricauda sp. SCSIO 64092]|uniref:hypothetical protein n=1 Tax=Allomuricauda sp. SCSIO 64092 TaxID=2908842 RepID=UPI001FF6B402|nr:hypothetical protein [Muricauda sp. SCSIO 64092]UOY07736.1 hypothetical protein L0P88_04095 [Muricauda sp. SCSIO 64092]